MVYRYRDGETFRGVKATDAGQELERIRKKYGGKLQPRAIVDEATDTESPLHDVFTWDDSEAAHAHRLWEARFFLRNIVVVQGQEEQPAFINVHIAATEEKPYQSYYQSTAVIRPKTEEYEGALQSCMTRLEAAQRALAELQRVATRAKKAKAQRAASHVRAAIREVRT